MTIFLTSHIGGYRYDDQGLRIPENLIALNGLVDQLKKRWKPNARVLFIASNPDNTDKSDFVKVAYASALPLSGLSMGSFACCDCRDEAAVNHLADFDVIILSGGHVPTQNAFFQRIGLREKLRAFDGLIIGISAGTMNAAEIVYAHPELEGEAIDPGYQRFLPGLGLTKLMILPHYQRIKDDVLDGLRVFEDVAYPDSYGRRFLCLNDGSYVIVEDGVSTLYGEAYEIRDGEIRRICQVDEVLLLEDA